MKKQLVIFEKWLDAAAEPILAARPDVEVHRLRYADPVDQNWAPMSRAHGYQISARGELHEPWFGNAALLARCPSLLAICSTGAGFDMVNVDECSAAGVLVCSQSGGNKSGVVEHVIGMMLSLSKKITTTNRLLLRGEMQDRMRHFGSEVSGKVLGIVGMGHIGTLLATVSRGLGMQVLGCDPYLSASEIAARGAVKVALRELLPAADFVTLHCPLTAETRNMIGRAELEAMKPTAFFINTSRGGTYDEDALAQALREQRIAGAGLDVFLREPPPKDHPLLQFDNVIATPHIAGMTHESTRKMATYAAEQWLDIFDGKRPPRLVNPEAWPLYCERFERIMGARPRDDAA